MIPALKLGIGAGIGYTIGGQLGAAAFKSIKPGASPDAVVGAMWAGRITTTLLAWYVLGRF